MPRQRASAIIIRNQEILLVRRENAQGQYFVFPGGGVKAGETPEQAVIREMREEAGVTVTSAEILQQITTERDDNVLILCTLPPDVKLVWQEHHKQTADNHYELVWISLSELPDLALYPFEGRNAVLRRFNR